MNSGTKTLYDVCRKKLLEELRTRYQDEYLGDNAKWETGKSNRGFGDDSTMRRSMTAPALINQPLKVELPPWLGFDTPRQARSRRASGDYKGTPENPGQELQALMAVLAKRKEASAHAGTAYRQAQQQRKQQQTERAPADQARERGVRPNHVSPLGERHAYARRDATPARCPSVGVHVKAEQL